MHIAQRIRNTTGENIRPWEVDDYPPDWLAYILALDQLPEKVKEYRELEEKLKGNG